jgi:(p)ppGpp synthase/HD superfamily hydrolase
METKYPKEKIELAKKYCVEYHKGQLRKGNGKPFHIHPFEVAEILKKYGYDDPLTICIAYLHDTIEDTPLAMDEIHENFGYEISNAVFVLSRNKGRVMNKEKLTREDYKQRLAFARKTIQRVKIADMIDNTRTLKDLDKEAIKRKIKDAEEFYIPLGKAIAPEMIKELIENIESYKKGVK